MSVRILDRYVLAETALPFSVGMGLFFVLTAFAQILEISDAVTGLGVTAGEIARAILYSMPPLVGLLIPVSALFATLFAIGRLASDGELTALTAGGTSPFALLRTPAVLGLVLAHLSAAAMIWGEPWGIRGLRDLMARSAQRSLTEGGKSGQFQQWIPGVVFWAREKDGRRLEDVFFADRRDDAKPVVIVAERGRILGGERAQDIVFALEEGSIVGERANPDDTDTYAPERVMHFERANYRISVGGLVSNKAKTLSSVQEMTVAELWASQSDQGLKPSARARRIITLHRKLAFPLATIIFSLLAVPLAATRKPNARARSFVFSALIVGAYYYVGRAAELSARAQEINPIFAAWLPNLLGVAALGAMLWQFRRRSV